MGSNIAEGVSVVGGKVTCPAIYIAGEAKSPTKHQALLHFVRRAPAAAGAPAGAALGRSALLALPLAVVAHQPLPHEHWLVAQQSRASCSALALRLLRPIYPLVPMPVAAPAPAPVAAPGQSVDAHVRRGCNLRLDRYHSPTPSHSNLSSRSRAECSLSTEQPSWGGGRKDPFWPRNGQVSGHF